MDYNSVVNAIPNPDYKEHIVKQYQGTADIIADLIYCFKLYNKQAQPISNVMRTGNIKTDSKKIYDFIKNNIVYNAEPFTNQTTASFSRIVHNKKGDCKHSALIVADIGYNMGYNVIFRFVSYEKNKNLGHVYTLLQDPKTKETIIVDPLQDFNYEKSFTKKKDYLAKNLKPNNMALTRMSGIDSETAEPIRQYIGNVELTMSPLKGMGKVTLKSLVSKVETAVKKVETKAATAVQKAAEKINPGTIVKKIALAPVRAGFDTLLFFNFRNMAGRLSQAIQTDPASMKTFAEKFGYSYPIFADHVAKGAAKKSIGGMDQIGIAVPVAVTAALVAASPIVVAVVPLIQKITKVKHPTDDQTVTQATKDIATLPDASVSSPYLKPILITLAVGTIIYVGGKQMGMFKTSK